VIEVALDTDLAAQLRQHVADLKWLLLYNFEGSQLSCAPVAKPANQSKCTLAEDCAIGLKIR
jgi:hypothetical protein